MSKFHTPIPVDISVVLKALPKGAYVSKVALVELGPNQNAVDIEWDCDQLRTAYTFPVDFPIENLKEQRLPKGTTALVDEVFDVQKKIIPKTLDKSAATKDTTRR